MLSIYNNSKEAKDEDEEEEEEDSCCDSPRNFVKQFQVTETGIIAIA